MHILQRFWIENQPLPDPEDSLSFNSAPLFPSKKDPTCNLSYQQQNKAFNDIFAMLGLDFAAVTHCGRIGGARQLDEGGCDAQVNAYHDPACLFSLVASG